MTSCVAKAAEGLLAVGQAGGGSWLLFGLQGAAERVEGASEVSGVWVLGCERPGSCAQEGTRQAGVKVTPLILACPLWSTFTGGHPGPEGPCGQVALGDGRVRVRCPPGPRVLSSLVLLGLKCGRVAGSDVLTVFAGAERLLFAAPLLAAQVPGSPTSF